MHEFAYLLKKYLDRAGLSCRSAAPLCNVERTSLTKYANGTRKPKAMEVVLDIARGLELSSEDTRSLCEAYERDKKGIKQDVGYTIIENLLNGKKTTYDKQKTMASQVNVSSYIKRKTSNLSCKEEILTQVDYITQNASSVKIYVNMECLDVWNVIFRNCVSKENCHIEQIIDIVTMGKSDEMIFQCFEKIYPLLLSNTFYRIWYHCRWGAESDRNNMKMNYVIADEGVLMFDSSLTYGIYLSRQDYGTYFEMKFETLCRGSRLFAKNQEDISSVEYDRMKYQVLYNEKSGMEFICNPNKKELMVHNKFNGNQGFLIGEEIIVAKIKEYINHHLMEKESGI